jgi:TolB-like protein
MQKKLLILLINCPFFVDGQITFQKIIGETLGVFSQDVKQTLDGNYIVAGWAQTDSMTFDMDFSLIKLSAAGDILWNKTYDSRGEDDNAYCVETTLDSGFIVIGQAQFDQPHIRNYVYLVRTDKNGDTLWTKLFNVDADERGVSVKQTSDGGFILSGEVWDSINFANDIYLIKTDANGNHLWSKAYGGAFQDGPGYVCQTSDGGYIIGGTADFSGSNNSDFYLIKTDASGNTLWSKTYDDGYNIDECLSLIQTTDHGFIMAGVTYPGPGNGDMIVVKTDSSGNELWSKTYGGSHDDLARSIDQTQDGGYVIFGDSYSFNPNGFSDVYLVRIDSNGNLLWSNTYGGASDDYGWSGCETNDGGYIIIGWTNGLGISGVSDAYIIKTDVNGNSGCNESICTTIQSTQAIQVSNPPTNTYTPVTLSNIPQTVISSCGVELSLCSYVGITESRKNNFVNFFPNPLHNSARLEINNSESKITNCELKIYSTLGVLVREEKILNLSSYILHRDNLSDGLYYFQLSPDGYRDFNSQLLGSGKFIVD